MRKISKLSFIIRGENKLGFSHFIGDDTLRRDRNYKSVISRRGKASRSGDRSKRSSSSQKKSIYDIREEVKSNRKSKEKRQKSPIEEKKRRHVEILSKFKTSIYDRGRKTPGKRTYSLSKKSVIKKLKSKVPSEKKKLDKKKYKLADLAKTRITTASRAGRSPEK